MGNFLRRQNKSPKQGALDLVNRTVGLHDMDVHSGEFPLDDITNEAPKKDTLILESQCSSSNENLLKPELKKKRNVSSDNENVTECYSKKSRILSPKNNEQTIRGDLPFDKTKTANKETPPQNSNQNHNQNGNARIPHVIHSATTQCRSGPSNTKIVPEIEGHSSKRASTGVQASNTPTLPHRSETRQSKRKFPGPAGLLPKLPPGRSPDVLDVSSANRKTKSPEQLNVQKDDIVMSSQSSEEVFTEAPWLTLITDLGENGQRLQRRWTLVSSLHKASKKQLLRGKVVIVMCVIETINWQGGDASVMLRDTSGRMPGTIHVDVMKEHDSDMQQGTVLVLRQVSVISPTARNHYLNITPSNLVKLYTKRDGEVFTKCFIHKDHSLSEILTRTEAESIREENAMRSPATSPTPRLHQSATRGPCNIPYRFQPRTPSAVVPRTPNAQTGPGHTPRMPMSGGVQRVQSGVANISRFRGVHTPVSGANTPSDRAVNNHGMTSAGGASRLQMPITMVSEIEPRYSVPITPSAQTQPVVNKPSQYASNTASCLNQSPFIHAAGAGLKTPNTSVNTSASDVPSHVGSRTFNNNTNSVMQSLNNTSSNNTKDVRDMTQMIPGSINTSSSAHPSVETTPNRKGFKFKSVNKEAIEKTHEKSSTEHVNNRSNVIMTGHRSFTMSNTNKSTNNSSANVLSASFNKDPLVKPRLSDNTSISKPSVTNNGGSLGWKENISSDALVSSAKTLPKALPKPCFEVDSEWNDDLSDDLLSQLSDEMM